MELVDELKDYTRSLIMLQRAEKAAQVAQKARDKAWREYYVLRDHVASQGSKLGFDNDEEIKVVKKLEMENDDADEEQRPKKKFKNTTVIDLVKDNK
jgi:hypothetical protein